MSSSTIRKAIGVVKDQTSIGLAKVSGTIAQELEVAILKATSHDDEPADEKHIREILNLSSYSRGYASACVSTVSRRLGKTRDWIVALKTLMLIHRLLNEDVPAFHHELLYATRRGTRLLNMSDFRDEAHSSSWDHSAFVRTYALFLDQRLEYMIPNNQQAGYGRGGGGGGGGGGFFYSPFEQQRSQPSYSYSDYSGGNHGKNSNLNFSRAAEMTPEKALDRMDQLQKLFDGFLACRPIGLAKSNRIIIAALYPIVRESFQLYADICEALAVLLDLFFDIEYAFCVKSFDAYANAAKQIDELNAFYGWCKDAGVARSSEYPAVQRITDTFLETLHEFMRNRAKSPNSSLRCVEPAPSVKTLPSPSDYEEQQLPEEPNPEPKSLIQPQPQGDLVDLREEDETAFPSADWELALVEAAGELAKKKTAQGGGFDHLPGPEKTDTAILSLLEADGTVQNIGGDPFAASLSIPPPSYVQMDDIAKKQQLLMQEQLLWRQYSQASQAKLNNAHYYPNQGIQYGMVYYYPNM